MIMSTTTRYYNPATGLWEVAGSNDAANITLKNEWLQDKDTTSISVERGFLKLNTRLSKLEHNLAWIYLNGAKGGGGGTGGGGGEYTINITGDKKVFYTSTTSVTINLTVNTGSTKKTVYVNAVNMSNGRFLVRGEAHLSKTPFDLVIPNLPGSTNQIYLQAYDAQDNYTGTVEITVNVGSIDITQVLDPSNSFTIGGANNASVGYQVMNKTGSLAYLLLYKTRLQDPLGDALAQGGSGANYWNADDVRVVNSSSTAGRHIFNLELILSDMNIGATATFKIVLYSPSLNYTSQYFTIQITVTSGDAVVAILYGLGENPDEAEQYLFPLNNFLNFGSLIYYEKTGVSLFYYRYKVYNADSLVYESAVFTRTPLTSGLTPTSCPTLDFELGNTYRLEFEVCATPDFTTDNELMYSKAIGYFGIKVGDNSELRDYPGRLLATFGAFNRTSDQATVWNYTIPAQGDYAFNEWPASVSKSTDLYVHNGTSTTGVLTQLCLYLNLSGSTYATIDRFALLFPASKTLASSLMNSGFYMQVTYKYLSNNPVNLAILSFGEYLNGRLFKGFEINSDCIRLAFGTSAGLEIETPIIGENAYNPSSGKRTETVTVGLNVWSSDVITNTGARQGTHYFAIYIDGTMTKCILVPTSLLTSEDTGWLFAKPLYLGCRSDLTNLANCYVYDFKLYSVNLNDLSIVWNYMSAVEQAHVIKNASGEVVVDPDLDGELRSKNLFNKNSNSCLLCGDDGEYLDPAAMYSRITQYYNEYELEYPVIYLQETAATSDMYQCIKATWLPSEQVNGQLITKKQWDVSVTITTKYGSLVMQSNESDDINGSHSPKIAIQGTSSLSYNSKNLELYSGYTSAGKQRLLKINGWLPENEYTLKGDVVDSAHVNNVAIGNFINNSGYVPHYPGSGYNASDNIRKKIKNTSEGFPCLVFIKYSDGSVANAVEETEEEDGTITRIGKTEFLGVYNFNLGRYAYHNLGLKTLLSYELDEDAPDDKPQIIDEYESVQNPNVYSLEVADNYSRQEELFTQADETISKYTLECRYTGTTEDDAYLAITGTPSNPALMVALARGSSRPAYERKRRTEDGSYETITDDNGNPLYWTSDSNSQAEALISNYIDFTTLRKYQVLALVFGMVDSTCKNMVLRSWNGIKWFTCFYDMDTAFKMDNGGAESIKYDAHFHRFFNEVLRYSDAGNSFNTGINQFPASNHTYDDWNYVYAGMCSSDGEPNRLWRILLQCDATALNDPTSNLESHVPGLYWILRNQYIKDADAFIDEYFAGYVNKTGSILYNYDYRQKYVSYSQTWKEGVGLVANTEAAQTSFLYGTRISTVRAWFKKRINFLDSVYASYSEGATGSYIAENWEGRQKANSTLTTLTIAANLKCKIGYSVSSGLPRYIWVDEEPRNYIIETQTEGNNWAMKGNPIVTLLPNFNVMKWSNLAYTLKFPLLRELNLEGCSVETLASADNLYAGGNGLANVLVINMKRFTCNTNITLGLVQCETLRELYLSDGCSVSSFTLPTSGSLQVLDLSNNANIAVLPTQTISGVVQSCLTNLSGLTTLLLQGTKITDMSGTLGLNNLPSLQQLQLPSTVTKLHITNCGLHELVLSWLDGSKLSPLTEIVITGCLELKSLNLSGLNNLTKIHITDCPNLEEINLSNVTCLGEVSINFASLTKLRSLNINLTSLFSSLDLSNCANLRAISAADCPGLNSITCDKLTTVTLVNLAFTGNTSLSTLKGHFNIAGSHVFEGCRAINFDLLLGTEELILDFSSSDLSYTFASCALISSSNTILNRVLYRIPDGLAVNLSHMFERSGAAFEISNVNVLFPKDKFINATDTSYMFSDSYVFGSILSEDEDTPGMFTYIPKVSNITNMFSNTRILYIDNDLFHWDMQNVTKMNNFLAGTKVTAITKCVAGKSDLTPKPLSSATFFSNIPKKVSDTTGSVSTINGQDVPNEDWLWPQNVLAQTNVEMSVDIDDNGMPMLFHTAHAEYKSTVMYLSNKLYNGVQFVCEEGIDYSQLFLPGTRAYQGKSYYVPNFIRISSPFSGTTGLKLTLPNGSGFFPSDVVSLYSPFTGIELTNTSTIPITLFKDCTKLVTANNVFSGVDLKNGDVPYTFEENGVGLFNDCTSLQDITGIFSGCVNFKMRLRSGMFKNCPLKIVTEAFSSSAVVGYLPKELFKCVGNNIQEMSGVFNNCFMLGYSDNVSFALYKIGETSTTGWTLHIIATGNKLSDYVVPNDLFWYCSVDPNIGNVLGSLFHKQYDALLGDLFYTVEELRDSNGELVYDGPVCKIPLDIFNGENISKSTKLTKVFADTRFLPETYDNLIEDLMQYQLRGPLYPQYLFKYTPNLKNISGMFLNTIIYAHNYINDDIFMVDDHTYLPLEDISYCWYDCLFNPYIILQLDITVDEGSSQLSADGYGQQFSLIPTITNISYLFAGSNMRGSGLKWTAPLNKTDVKLLDYSPTGILNVTGTLMNAKLLSPKIGPVPTVPLFSQAQLITGGKSYLSGVEESLVANSEVIKAVYTDRLCPDAWLRTEQ